MVHGQSIVLWSIGAFVILALFIGCIDTEYESSVAAAEELAADTLDEVTPLPVVTAKAWGIFQNETGVLLASEAADTVLPIASVTKLFVAAATQQSDLIDTELSITWSDLNTEGRAGKLTYGMVTTPRTLLVPLLIESSNDAGEAIRRTLGDTQNTELEKLFAKANLSKTKIVDGSGLSARNVSTVAELARFYGYLQREHPELLKITTLRLYLREDTGLVNNNPLREHQQFVDGKHGFTPEAQKTYVGSFVNEAGRHYGLVLLGSSNLEADATVLLTYAASL